MSAALPFAAWLGLSVLALAPGLGDHSRPVTTIEPAAQALFDEGLAYLSAFNHDEALRAFTDATALDPACAMCFWGVAMAQGPSINLPHLPPERAGAAHAAARRAVALKVRASVVEQGLIDAQARRFEAREPRDRGALNRAYTRAMREVVKRFPDDADAAAWLAEALLVERPWDQWTRAGAPQPGTEEALRLLDGVLARDASHPLANHLLVHTLESSPWPERADAAAERLRTLAPALGHLVHMPSHIDVRRGRFGAAIEANEAAIRVDDAYLAAHPETGIYRTYVLHNRHMLAFAAMMSGRSVLALARAGEIGTTMPAAWIAGSPLDVDGFLALRTEVLVRFGRWDDLLQEPEPAAALVFSRAMWRYGRVVALAARGDAVAARAELARFGEARRRVPKTQVFGANKTTHLLDVAAAMAAGEVALAEQELPRAIRFLEDAVRADESLRYDEPPDWILPPRHPLGAALLKAGRAADAEQVFRADLARWPDNVWGLWGLTTALAAQGVQDAALTARFARAKATADVALTTSCFCLPGL